MLYECYLLLLLLTVVADKWVLESCALRSSLNGILYFMNLPSKSWLAGCFKNELIQSLLNKPSFQAVVYKVLRLFCLILLPPRTERRKSSLLSLSFIVDSQGLTAFAAMLPSRCLPCHSHSTETPRKWKTDRGGIPLGSFHRHTDSPERLETVFGLIIFSMTQLKLMLLKCLSNKVREKRVKADCMLGHYFFSSEWQHTVWR